MGFMGIKGDRPEGAADGQFCTRRKCRRLRCGVLAAVLAAGICLGGCQGKNVETMAAFAEKEGAEDGTGAADSADGEFGMWQELKLLSLMICSGKSYQFHIQCS